jgi:hypothetical protein
LHSQPLGQFVGGHSPGGEVLARGVAAQRPQRISRAVADDGRSGPSRRAIGVGVGCGDLSPQFTNIGELPEVCGGGG